MGFNGIGSAFPVVILADAPGITPPPSRSPNCGPAIGERRILPINQNPVYRALTQAVASPAVRDMIASRFGNSRTPVKTILVAAAQPQVQAAVAQQLQVIQDVGQDAKDIIAPIAVAASFAFGGWILVTGRSIVGLVTAGAL